MGDITEVMFATAASENHLACSAWDFRTGTNLMTYKASGATSKIHQHSLSIIRAEYVLAADSLKPLLHVWPINAQEQVATVRFVLPGKVNAMAVSPDGHYLVAGIQETIYVWHLTTGRMLNSISKHYQNITCIRFTDDGSHFVSASQDGSLLVWNLSKVAAGSTNDDNSTPLYSFTDHGLPVTDVHIGGGGIRAYMYSVSLDRTCRVYNLASGALLLTVVFTEGLQSVTVSALESAVYVGTIEGNIYEFHIGAVPRTKEYHIDKEYSNKFVGHAPDTKVNCLTLSLDGETLVSGGEDAHVCLWYIPSRQLLRKMPFKGAITNVALRLSNPAVFQPEHKQPQIFHGNLKRMIDPPHADEDQVIEVRVSEQLGNGCEYTDDVASRSVIFGGVAAAAGATGAAAKSTPHEGQDEEVQKLRAEVERLRQVNKQLFETSVKHLISNNKTKPKKVKK